MKSKKIERERKTAVLQSIQYSVDFVTAILLLTGQITTSGLFIVPEGFYLASTGEILGGVRLTGQTSGAVGILRLVDIIAALLLVVNAVRVTGPYITSGRAFIVFSGEIFGVKEIAGVVPVQDMNIDAVSELREFFRGRLLHGGD